MIGRTLAHYRITASLDAGGMGQVYRARDLHLDRDVAVKVLTPERLPDAEAHARFRREALALSELHHPHIAVVHDFSEQDGVAFLVMELVEGESLARRLERGPLEEGEARRLGSQIASALGAAHARGIVHRDLKPSNIMLTPSGDAKVVDFGIAKRVSQPDAPTVSQLTLPQTMIGTLPYMAPEMLRGEPVDARSDIFAFGAVLYEMATGHPPFSGPTSLALAGEILNRDPEPVRTLRPEVSPAFDDLIRQCLAKDPSQRLASASEAAQRLTMPAEDRTREKTPRHLALPHRRTGWLILALLLAAGLLGFGIDRYVRWLSAGRAIQSLAVLPLENLSRDPDQDFFAAGMTDELTVRLQSIDALRVISRSSVLALDWKRLSASEIGRKLHVDGLVTGSIQRVGQRVRIRAQLIRTRNDQSLWAASFERSSEDALGLQSDVARAVVDRVRARLAPEEQTRLTATPRLDQAALDHYLRGKLLASNLTSEKLRAAVDEFDKAIEIAPSYAPAYASLAEVYILMSGEVLASDEAMTRARAMAQKALDLDPGSAPAYGALGSVLATYDYDPERAEEAFRRGLAISPHDPSVLQSYGQMLHVYGKFDDALVLFRRARAQDPLSPYVAVQSVWPLNQGRRYEESIRETRTILDADQDNWFAHFILAQSLAFSGRRSEGVTEFEQAWRQSHQPIALGWLAWGYGCAGRPADARLALDSLQIMAKGTVVQPYCFALANVGMGHNDEALRWLSRAVDERTTEATFIGVDPAWDPIRRDPRFVKLLERVKLDPASAGKVHGLDDRVRSRLSALVVPPVG